MTRVLALAGQSKVGCISQRRFAQAGTKPHSQRGAALDRTGLSVSTETACRFEPKSPVGNSEICSREDRAHRREGWSEQEQYGRGHRRTSESRDAPDSPLEGAGFEPS